jgi:hypothetical protein
VRALEERSDVGAPAQRMDASTFEERPAEAETWFEENDLEGVAFEYEVLE